MLSAQISWRVPCAILLETVYGIVTMVMIIVRIYKVR